MRDPKIHGWANALAVEVTRTQNGQKRTVESFSLTMNPTHLRNVLADHFTIDRARLTVTVVSGDPLTATIRLDGNVVATAKEL